MTQVGYPSTIEDMTPDQLEALMENESDVLDGADIYGVIATVADFIDLPLVSTIYALMLPHQREGFDINPDLIISEDRLSTGEVRLIGDLIDNSQSNPSSAYPALLRMALADNELGNR